MSEPTVIDLLKGLSGRRGAIRLLRHLGFVDPPLRDDSGTDVHSLARAVLATGNGVLRAWLIELRGVADGTAVRAVTRALREADPIAFHLYLISERDYSRCILACAGPDRALRHASLERSALRASDIDIVAEMVPRADEVATARALRIAHALDRSRITDRFFRDVAGMRDLISRAWTGIPRTSTAARDALALLLISRLLFLYFLQRRGRLAGDTEYLPNLLRRSRQGVFRGPLRTLFFGALNRRPERRSEAALALGALPYLNGGLFEEHRLERRHPRLDLPDGALARVFTALLEKYRFTTVDVAEAQRGDAESTGIDPEMLGRIFEGLMPGEQRGRTGSFYTPPAIVERIVRTVLSEHLAGRCAIPVAELMALLDAPALCDDGLRTCVARELAALRIVDPACGSGAFLMGALMQVERLRLLVGDAAHDVRRDIVARTLHGVDLLEDAALICSLRLWLALIPSDHVAEIPPLPNLDRRVRQGDALIDPLDLRGVPATGPFDVPRTPELRRIARELAPAAAHYLQAEPEEKEQLRVRLDALERSLARSWMRALADRLTALEKELHARAADRDLFGDPVAHAQAAARRIARVTDARSQLHSAAGEMTRARALPFFSFRVHFAEAADGFDIVLSNPPWVRAHRWPPAVRSLLRRRYRVCVDAGWPEAARLSRLPAGAGAQVDLSLLFLERSIELLAAGGTLGMLLPAKLFRSLYAGGARALVSERLQLLSIEDVSLDHRAIFDADAFTAVLIAQRRRERSDGAGVAGAGAHAAEAGSAARPGNDGVAPHAPHAPRPVRVTLMRSGMEPLRFCVPVNELALVPGDARAPWLLVPPECASAFRRMQRAAPLGEHAGVRIRRGVMTGCNEVLVLRHVEPKLGDLAFVRAEGHGRSRGTESHRGFSAFIEASVVRPALRGTDIDEWHFDPRRHLIFVPANDRPGTPPPPRAHRYLQRHRTRLRGDRAVGASGLGALHRLGAHTLGHKVVWSDVAKNLRAAAVPARIRAVTGEELPLVPLNTVYFLATASDEESLLLAAYLNATPVRTFARAIAERAKDAHFRFFAWTIAVMPVPLDWRHNAHAPRLLELSARAHERGAMAAAERCELDDIVCRSYGLTAEHARAIVRMDAWLSGKERVHA